MPAPHRRRRLINGCHRCRVRHLKCDTNVPSCRHCTLARVECDRELNVRFRTGLGFANNHDNAFPERDLWPRLTQSLEFQDETLDIQNLYKVVVEQPLSPGCGVEPVYYDARSSPTDVLDYRGVFLGEQHYPESRNERSSFLAQQLAVGNSVSPHNEEYSPSHHSTNSGIDQVLPTSTIAATHLSGQQPSLFTDREAVLMRNFVENMALWADITDAQRHFENDVPLRAIREPVLRSAIFAFSSRHIDRRKDNTAEALQYHNECLQLLIPVLSGSRETINDVVLAAVAILRQHEEMDNEDNQFHLTGITHILNTVSSFGSSGGLGEAAAWLCLREDIYISLTSQKPLRADLQSFENSDVFLRNDDYSWASRMVFLLAKVLKCAFSHGTSHHGLLLSIGEEVENWNASKPTTFAPIRSTSRGREPHERLPNLWMLLPVHVVGVQYYHIAKIVLALASYPTPSLTYDKFRSSRNTEKAVRNHLLTVLGLAKSNARAENTLFTARHSLVAWGWVLRNRLDQEAAEDLLHEMEQRTGWDVAQTIHSLRMQWHEDDSDH